MCNRKLSQKPFLGELGQIWCKTYFLSIPISLSYLRLDLPLENTVGRCSKNNKFWAVRVATLTQDNSGQWEEDVGGGGSEGARPGATQRNRPRTVHFQALLLPGEQSGGPHT